MGEPSNCAARNRDQQLGGEDVNQSHVIEAPPDLQSTLTTTSSLDLAGKYCLSSSAQVAVILVMTESSARTAGEVAHRISLDFAAHANPSIDTRLGIRPSCDLTFSKSGLITYTKSLLQTTCSERFTE